MFKLAHLFDVAQAADNAWMAELTRLHGKRACNVRYTKLANGPHGSTLRRLYDDYVDARDAYLDALHARLDTRH